MNTLVLLKKHIVTFIGNLYHSFPMQLLMLHLKKNLMLLFIWGTLFGIVTGNVGREFGVPYLFLDPEYQNKVSPLSLFIMGLAFGGFDLSFHITSYSLESNRFQFLGYLRRPFTKFFLNNAVLPTLFIVVYIVNFIKFQTESESITLTAILYEVGAFVAGFSTFLLIFFNYFVGTNKDVFKILGPRVARLSEKRRVKRLRRMGRRDGIRVGDPLVKHYFESPWRIRKVDTNVVFNKTTIQQVFAQNHLNSIIVEVALFVSILIMGIFDEKEIFHIPAGASLLLFFTIVVMVTGWASYWFKEWTIVAIVVIFASVNFLSSLFINDNVGQAFGMQYKGSKAEYTLSVLKGITRPEIKARDSLKTIDLLNHWKQKFVGEKKLPKMIFLCASGGGLRAFIWTIKNLQAADSLSGGAVMNHTLLITGASGGMLGAGLFRELYLRKKMGSPLKLSNKAQLEAAGKDNLNTILFNLVLNDIFLRSKMTRYQGMDYVKDRGVAFEEQMNKNTSGILNKSIDAYAVPEAQGLIPMMILAPTIVNDGRKLYISAQDISYLSGAHAFPGDSNGNLTGIEFRKFFKAQRGDSLRFLTALRMSASFPYVTPNIELPSTPAMEVMDAGVTDNYGLYDAFKFSVFFREWINRNTSGIIFLSIRDAPSERPVVKKKNLALLDRILSTVVSFYSVWHNVQDNYNDAAMGALQGCFTKKINVLELPYTAELTQNTQIKKKSRDSISVHVVRGASLSWHLTRFEKENIQESFNSESNQQTLKRLNALVEDH